MHKVWNILSNIPSHRLDPPGVTDAMTVEIAAMKEDAAIHPVSSSSSPVRMVVVSPGPTSAMGTMIVEMNPMKWNISAALQSQPVHRTSLNVTMATVLKLSKSATG